MTYSLAAPLLIARRQTPSMRGRVYGRSVHTDGHSEWFQGKLPATSHSKPINAMLAISCISYSKVIEGRILKRVRLIDQLLCILTSSFISIPRLDRSFAKVKYREKVIHHKHHFSLFIRTCNDGRHDPVSSSELERPESERIRSYWDRTQYKLSKHRICSAACVYTINFQTTS